MIHQSLVNDPGVMLDCGGVSLTKMDGLSANELSSIILKQHCN